MTQRLRDGHIEVLDVPEPAVAPENVLIDVRASLLSAGTERAKVQTGRQSLVGKARSRPHDVQQVLSKVRTEGLRSTVATVRARLDQPSPIGYSAAGVVRTVGPRVRGLAPGDRVACGGGDAVHAEVVSVPGNLCAPLPDQVEFGEAAFATVGAVAMHAIRQADVGLGARVAVIGLGLVGQLAGLLLRSGGVTVVGVDTHAGACTAAAEAGAIDVPVTREALDGLVPSEAAECDAVLVTAATTSSDPIEVAARLCRDRGRVVIVGDVGLVVPRAPYYDKELDIRLSRSYGPGRYDRNYEERGLDYPIGYVRWTEQRNMAAFVELVGRRRIDVRPLITERYPIEAAAQAYQRLLEPGGSPLGILLEYAGSPARSTAPAPRTPATAIGTRLGLIGAGSFAQRILIPGFAATGFSLVSVASQSGLSAAAVRERFGFGRAETVEELLDSEAVDVVAIATRHDTHAELATAALEKGKAVFVEKPPALDLDDLARLEAARDAAGRPLAVGFNRRHAPLTRRALEHLGAGPREVVIRVHAVRVPADHWLNDPTEGGGRLIGEGCHFVDLACWLVGQQAESVSCSPRHEPGNPFSAAQSFAVALTFSDGSLASITYAAEGAARLPKERIEVHGGGRSAIIDDFRRLELHGEGRIRRSSGRQDKGHETQLSVFEGALEGGTDAGLDPLGTMRATLMAARSAERGCTLSLRPDASGEPDELAGGPGGS